MSLPPEFGEGFFFEFFKPTNPSQVFSIKFLGAFKFLIRNFSQGNRFKIEIFQ